MSTFRVTHNMLAQRSLDGMMTASSRVSKVQEHLTTGRIINRPSDDPTGTTAAMRMRTSIAEAKQHARNADDGLGWLAQADSTLMSMTDQVRRARELAIRGANTGSVGPAAREALATEVDQLRTSLLAAANTTYLDRPVFGGTTAGGVAYDSDGLYAGDTGQVRRTVGDGVQVRVDTDAVAVFGPDGANLFDDLTALSAALRAGDAAGIAAGGDAMRAGLDRLTTTLADVGTRSARLEVAAQAARDAEVDLVSSLSEVENTDLPKAMVDLQLQEVAYQAALAATARVMQPSLMEFLR
ncbi:flagellar hook-associated protein FlgL [Nocardioides perillae]|uniref:Flagellar hook-associated protein 3 FlgL n=1 Tax=Nocardioides perillae TaxID=1119534 RepID=A0A7Y9RYD8_9ACTN|nr:flagellar hook-associated protein FlgL [Nocardioides perillae]NYG57017.1 flagellar hook-associated protein 3 FlgL [Nocardioides perillae]